MSWFSSKKANSFAIDVDGMSCDGCVRSLTKKLTSTPGVEKVEVVLEPRGRALISGTLDENEAREAIKKAGYVPL